MRHAKLTTSLAGLMLASTFLLGGCVQSQNQPITAQRVRGRTPELATMRMSEGQLKNKEARVINSHLRGLRDDIHRALMLNTNDHLNPYPVP